MDNERLWQAKLAAWIHDPAEKALVLLRDPSGHEGGTVAALRNTLFGSDGVPATLVEIVKRADHWASAADRPKFPGEKQHASWVQVRFVEQPVLINPLSGNQYSLAKLSDIDFKEARAVSLGHFERLIVRTDRGIDYRRTFLSFWRRGPVSPDRDLGALWEVLPADTRVPDHTIWDHLQLTSAFAGAMAGSSDCGVALLALSLGPVQSFIEQGRSTSDLWAGSHLLSRLAWEALQVVCERCGPDSVIYPHLHGVPLVDLWLRREGIETGEPDLDNPTDANPAFVASLPNRFVAIVPEELATDLAHEIEQRVRGWVGERAEAMVEALLAAAGLADAADARARLRAQAGRQLRDFPEVSWAIVPWRLAGVNDRLAPEDPEELRRVTRVLVSGAPAGALLDTPAWDLLSGVIDVDGAEFYRPNPGVLYPDLMVLLDRVLAASKATRTFEPAFEIGYRCSLCGEREWLTDDPRALARSRGEREHTLWTRVSATNPSWSRKGEHLCALCALKRLWPGLFAGELAGLIDMKGRGLDELRRFVVSTHTMALAPTLDRVIETLYGHPTPEQLDAYRQLAEEIDQRRIDAFVALPKRLADDLTTRRAANEEYARQIRRMPALLDRLAEDEDEDAAASRRVRKALRCIAGVEPERYYALVLLDGDRMGAWLSATDDATRLPFEASWHPQVRDAVQQVAARAPRLAEYLKALRPASPARHIFISRALNGFAQHLARLIVEERYTGRLLYAGGDDLLAMVAIDDLLEVLMGLRCAYSGIAPGDEVELDDLLGRARPGGEVRIGGDHVLVRRGGRCRLLRMMGERATLSAGVVIAHYSAPLGVVLRELRGAERRAKQPDGGGRDAFSVTLMKRAGGLSHFTSKWFPGCGADQMAAPPGAASHHAAAKEGRGDLHHTSIGLLLALRNAFARDLSRRAAYHLLEWLEDLGPDAPDEQVQRLLEYQFARQTRRDGSGSPDFSPGALAEHVVKVAAMARDAGRRPRAGSGPSLVGFMRDALALAEFLAREGRVQSEPSNAGA